MTTSKNNNSFDYYEANWNDVENITTNEKADQDCENILTVEDLNQLQKLDSETPLTLTSKAKGFIKNVNENIKKKKYQHKFTPQELQATFKNAQANDRAAMEKLYTWFLPLVKSIAHSYSYYSIFGEDAENICWEQFFIFVEHYKGRDFKRLPGLIKLRLISRMADAANSRRYSDPLVEYNDLALENCLHTDDSLKAEIKNIHLYSAFLKLKPLRQIIIHKYYFEELKGTEIALALKITYKAYRHHHYYALNELRRYYLEHKVLGI